jgi:hypothetical protein
MTQIAFWRRMLGILGSVATLSGCAALQRESPGSPVIPQNLNPASQPIKSQVLRNLTENRLLYVASRGHSYVLNYPTGELVGTIDAGAQAACSDSVGNVYLVEDNRVVEYAHGGTTPIKTITLPGGGVAGGGCSVDPTSGDLAVTFGGVGVAIYQSAQGSPTTYQDNAVYCGYDNQGNLFSDGSTSSGGLIISELPAGGAAFMALSISKRIQGDPWQVQWDGHYVTVQTVGPAQGASVNRLSISGSVATVVGVTHLKGFSGAANQSWIIGKLMFMPVGRRGIGVRTPTLGVWKYPAGGKPTKKFKGFAGRGRGVDLYGLTSSFAT